MLATCFVHPMDVVKNRMQVSGIGSKVKEYKTSFHAAGAILKNEGVATLYTGLSAGLLRQATYTTARLGVFNGLTDMASYVSTLYSSCIVLRICYVFSSNHFVS